MILGKMLALAWANGPSSLGLKSTGPGQLVHISQYHSISVLLYDHHMHFKTLKGDLPVIILKIISFSSKQIMPVSDISHT